VIADAAGTVLSRHDYYPFGAEQTASTDGETHKFTGKERDVETGLDYFGARYYHSGHGRFMSPDEFTGGPVGAFSSNDPLPDSPLPYADITNPQSLNKYTYTYNNPLRFTDPNGHAADTLWDVFNIVIGIGSAISNYREGNYRDAAIDAGGVAVDTLAASVPFVPGGMGTAIKASRLADRMAEVRRLGEVGRKASGVVKNTERIISLSGTAKFRVPDGLNKGDKVIAEVKNVSGKLSYTAQLKDFALFAQKSKDYVFELHVPKGTEFTKPLQEAIEAGAVKIVEFEVKK
jgi:RHS repeat-associated protein